MKFVVYNPTTHLFDFFINVLFKELENKNIETLLINKIEINFFTNKFDFKNDIILIIVNPHFIFDYSEINDNIQKIRHAFKYKILYLTEPINFIVEKRVYLELVKTIKPYVLWTYTYENFNKIKYAIKTFKIFPSYNEKYNFINIDIDNIKLKNNNKIIFFGNITENRKKICNQFNKFLINYTDTWSQEEWSNILNNNLFYLNIHRRINCKTLESFRIIPILANGGVIFSELCNELEENLFKEYNIIFVSKDKLYETFFDYIQNIDYESIFEKAKLFREKIIKDQLDDYLDFHNCFIKIF
jgi:hypothetical protein